MEEQKQEKENNGGEVEVKMRELRPKTEEVDVVVRERQPKKDVVLPVSIIVAAVMIAGAILFATLYKGGLGSANNTLGANNGGNGSLAAAPAPSSASTSAILALGPRDAILGNANAPVTIIEYGDYQCPFCSQYFENVEPAISQQYIATGKAKFVFRNFAFLGPESIAAAEAAECAEDQGQLWPYHDALYRAKSADFAKGGSEDDGLFSRTLFLSIAKQLNLDLPTFTTCIDSNKYASLVAQEKSDAAVIGVQSTPATLVNGVPVTDSSGNNVGANSTAVLAAIAAAVAK